MAEAAETKIKKGDTVFYTNSAGTFQARVKTVHRDGSVTILAQYEVRDGKMVPFSALGFNYRTDANRLFDTATRAAADFAS